MAHSPDGKAAKLLPTLGGVEPRNPVTSSRTVNSVCSMAVR
jgi:hypothetical protein